MKLNNQATKDKFEALEHESLIIPGCMTPDVSVGEIEPMLSVRYSRDYLISQLKATFSSLSQIPIEKYEMDLYELSKKFNKDLHGKVIDIDCVSKVHHIQKAANNQVSLLDIPENKFSMAVKNLLRVLPYIFYQYQTFASMLKIWDGLIVKWKIAVFKNYDYRCSGRALNVRMLNMSEINTGFFNLEVFWLSSKIFEKPLNSISNCKLLELARVLHYQLKKTMKIFLYLNPKQVDEFYDIEKTLAFKSENFWKWAGDQCPEENLSSFRHVELKMLTGISRCFGSNDQRIELVYRELIDLELVYRNFEKGLIASILNITGKAEF